MKAIRERQLHGAGAFDGVAAGVPDSTSTRPASRSLPPADAQISLWRDRTLPAPEIRRAGAADALASGNPPWVENLLLKAVARESEAALPETAEEFLLALERGAARPLAAP